jgi:hypothetical protein
MWFCFWHKLIVLSNKGWNLLGAFLIRVRDQLESFHTPFAYPEQNPSLLWWCGWASCPTKFHGDDPDHASIWRTATDLSIRSPRSLTSAISGGNGHSRAGLCHHCLPLTEHHHLPSTERLENLFLNESSIYYCLTIYE